MNVYDVLWLNGETSEIVCFLCVTVVWPITLRIALDISAIGTSYEKKPEERHMLMKVTKNVNVLNSVKHTRSRKSNSILTS